MTHGSWGPVLIRWCPSLSRVESSLNLQVLKSLHVLQDGVRVASWKMTQGPHSVTLRGIRRDPARCQLSSNLLEISRGKMKSHWDPEPQHRQSWLFSGQCARKVHWPPRVPHHPGPSTLKCSYFHGHVLHTPRRYTLFNPPLFLRSILSMSPKMVINFLIYLASSRLPILGSYSETILFKFHTSFLLTRRSRGVGKVDGNLCEAKTKRKEAKKHRWNRQKARLGTAGFRSRLMMTFCSRELDGETIREAAPWGK